MAAARWSKWILASTSATIVLATFLYAWKYRAPSSYAPQARLPRMNPATRPSPEAQTVPVQPTRTVHADQAATRGLPAGADIQVDPALLQVISSQVPPAADTAAFDRAAALAPAEEMWRKQDAILLSWPKYEDVRDQLHEELSTTMDLEGASVGQLRREAAELRARFWVQEGPLSPQGYREAFKARLLLEIAVARELESLQLVDDLVETILTAYPMDCYNPETGQRGPNWEVVHQLRALRAQGYAQTRKEVEAGRPFTWADFARVSDYAGLFSAADTPKAAEAFEWALAQAGPNIPKRDWNYFHQVLDRLRTGRGVNFSVYRRAHEDFPHHYIYGRRLPSFLGPTHNRVTTPRWVGMDSLTDLSYGRGSIGGR